MAFPVEAAATGAGESASTATHVLNLPSSISSGNLLVLVFHIVGNATITTPTGWTSVLTATDGTTQRVGIFYRIADGTEGSTVSVTTSATVRGEYRSLRFTGAHGSTAPEASSAAYASSNAPDSPSLDPTGWGTEDTLWYAIEAGNDAAKTVTTYPTNYTGGVQHASSGGTPGQLALASRSLNAASADPGAFALSGGGASRTVGITLAIRPVPAAQTLTPTAIASTAALGSQTNKGLNTLVPTARATTLALGSPVLKGLNTLIPTARSSSLALGSTVIHPFNSVFPSTIRRGQILLDTFTGADGASLSAAWSTLLAGDWQISNNHAVQIGLTANNGQFGILRDVGLADVTVRCVVNIPSGSNAGLIANYVDANNYWLVQISDGACFIWEVVAGGFTFRASAGMSAGQYNARIVTADDIISFYLNDVLLVTYTGSPRVHKTSTLFGLRTAASDPIPGSWFDNFSIGTDFIGDPTLIHVDNLFPVARASSLSLGTPTLASQYVLLPNSRGSSLNLGSPTVHPFNTLAPSSRVSTLNTGSPTLSGQYTIIPNGLASTSALGEPLISSQVIDVLGPTGIASTKQLGGHTLHTFNTLQPSGRGSTLALGVHTIKGLYTLGPASKISTVVLGNNAIKSLSLMVPNGVPSLATVVSPSISSVFAIRPTGRPSTIQLGLHRLMQPTIIIPNGRPSTVVLGLPRVFQVVFPDVCEPLALVISQTTPTGLLIASSGESTLEVVHVAPVTLEVIKNDTELSINPSTVTFLEVVCDDG